MAEPVDLREELMTLSNVSKTIDGTGFAYTSLECTGKNVGEIGILELYAALRELDVSNNQIYDVDLVGKLEYALRLKLASNAIQSIDCWGAEQLLHLCFLDLSDNQLEALPGFTLPALRTASFARNQIATCEGFRGHRRLMELDLSGNNLSSLAGIGDMPALQRLNVAGQRDACLISAEGLSGLPALHQLDLSRNGLPNLDGPWDQVPMLSTLDASKNQISEVMGLEALANMPELRNFQVMENPLDEADVTTPVKIEALIFSSSVQYYNGEEVTEEERDEAKSTHEKRVEEEEQRRLEAEEAERAQQEGGGEAEEEDEKEG